MEPFAIAFPGSLGDVAMLNVLWKSRKGNTVTGVGGYGTGQRVWRETTVENLGTDYNARRKMSLFSLPEGGMFVSITRCSQVKQLRIPKDWLRYHRLITCLHIFCFRCLVIGGQALNFVLTRM